MRCHLVALTNKYHIKVLKLTVKVAISHFAAFLELQKLH